ncbi:MAG: rubrerythrin family protein [Deltaproteobacteria bacterium]|nr:rubrerythrin family protein [Deltaproteobacteria bacterium]
MSKSLDNLKEAFAGESQANRRYLAFARKAEQEGYHQVAKLFRAAAEAETVHAHNHLRAMKGVGTTAQNLEEAVEGENSEFRHMYPRMIADAQAEGDKEALRTFNFANEVEKVHARLFQKALDNLDNKEEADIYVCQVCGYTVEGEPPDKCPVCNANKKQFKSIV